MSICHMMECTLPIIFLIAVATIHAFNLVGISKLWLDGWNLRRFVNSQIEQRSCTNSQTAHNVVIVTFLFFFAGLSN